MFSSCKNNPDKIIVADFKGNNLSVSDVLDKYNMLDDESKKEITDEEGYYRFIRKIALEKIILDKLHEENYQEKEKNIKDIERIRKDSAFQILLKNNVDSKVSIIKEDYQKYRKRYTLFQIVRRTDELDESKIKESRVLLEKLRKEIKDVEAFKNAAKMYSDDVTASDSGYVGRIRLGIMEDAIDKAIVKLDKNVVSDIIESSNGMHILFIDKIDEVSDEELFADQEIYDLIKKEKRDKAEEDWYNKLLSLADIDREAIKEKKYDDKIVAVYGKEKITRKDLFEKIDNFKDKNFPEPTTDEIYNFLKNMVLNIILKNKSMEDSITTTKEYKQRVKREMEFLLINNYIEDNINQVEIPDLEIEKFYRDNIKTLFTFKNDNGSLYIQPINEVKDFIIEKIKPAKLKESRYELYRKLVEDANLKINKEMIAILVSSITL